MEFNCKCMYLGNYIGKTKNGDEFKQLKFLDKLSNEIITCYVNDLGKFEKQQLYTDCDVKFNLYKDNKGMYRVNLVM